MIIFLLALIGALIVMAILTIGRLGFGRRLGVGDGLGRRRRRGLRGRCGLGEGPRQGARPQFDRGGLANRGQRISIEAPQSIGRD